MRVAWIVNAHLLEDAASGGLYSSIASYRYRMLIPGSRLAARGFDVAVIGVTPDEDGYERGRTYLEGLDVVVFGKMSDAIAIQPRLMSAARAAGVRTVVDVCDDIFDRPGDELLREVVTAADAVSTSSPFLATRIAGATGRRAAVINDPYEGARGEPRWQPGPRITAVWFGNVTNLSGLELAMDGLKASGIPMRVVVVTYVDDNVRDWLREQAPILAPAIELEAREWSLEATAQALRECDVVLLPIDRRFWYYLSKGPNRMVEALWAGRFVVAQPLPAYEEFREWAWIGEEISGGLAWAAAHPAEITGRIAQAQEHIAGRYSPAAAGSAWAAFLTDLREGRLAGS